MEEGTDPRFLTSVLVLATCGFASVFISVLPMFLYSLLSLALAIIVAQWFCLFAPTLTRNLRAIVDEANVLRTTPYRPPFYSPRKDPEGMTPAPGSQAERERNFKEARDAHYANEFTNIPKLSEEISKKPVARLPPESEKLMKMFEDDIESQDI